MTTAQDVAIGTSTTFESHGANRVARRSGSHTDPKRPSPTIPTVNARSLGSQDSIRRHGNETSSIPSTVLFTSNRNSLDAMEQGFAALRHEKVTPKRSWWRSVLGFLVWVFRVVAGQNEATRNWLVFTASLLGVLLAISTIFGWPALPLASGKPGGGSTGPIIELHGRPDVRVTTTVVNNYFYCTFINEAWNG